MLATSSVFDRNLGDKSRHTGHSRSSATPLAAVPLLALTASGRWRPFHRARSASAAIDRPPRPILSTGRSRWARVRLGLTRRWTRPVAITRPLYSWRCSPSAEKRAASVAEYQTAYRWLWLPSGSSWSSRLRLLQGARPEKFEPIIPRPGSGQPPRPFGFTWHSPSSRHWIHERAILASISKVRYSPMPRYPSSTPSDGVDGLVAFSSDRLTIDEEARDHDQGAHPIAIIPSSPYSSHTRIPSSKISPSPRRSVGHRGWARHETIMKSAIPTSPMKKRGRYDLPQHRLTVRRIRRAATMGLLTTSRDLLSSSPCRSSCGMVVFGS